MNGFGDSYHWHGRLLAFARSCRLDVFLPASFSSSPSSSSTATTTTTTTTTKKAIMKPTPTRRISRIVLPFCALFLIFYLLPFPLTFGPGSHDTILADAPHHDRPPATQAPAQDPPPPWRGASNKVVERPEKIAPQEAPATTQPRPPLPKHKYRADGLVEVNPDGPHPIYELIENAEKAWNEKLSRQSQTLEAAVEEYRRRYKRAPPKGFELWWQYIKENNVQLPDEYDQIHKDLEPFWGVDPADLRKTQEELEKKKDSYTLGKDANGDIAVLAWAFEEGRYDHYIRSSVPVIAILDMVKTSLPPSFRATFSPHDGPNRLSDYGIKTTVLEAAASHSVLERSALPKVQGKGWRFACPPTSPARTRPVSLNHAPAVSPKKTFIHDHVASMDPCQHTNHFLVHGQFIGQGQGPHPQPHLVPEFGHCSTLIHHNIRMPSPYAWVEDVYPRSADPPFEEKPDERLLWRGRNTGIHHNPRTLWRNSHRDFFMRTVNEISGVLSILPSNTSKHESVGEPREVRKARVNPALVDAAFAEGPVMCEGRTCEELEEIYPWRGFQGPEEAGRYKYVFDIDGNGWSGRFKRLITSNALIFKATIYPEWFHDRVQPWVHYVPIQMDLSDLYDVLYWFRGDAAGVGAHEEEGRRIAERGREWSRGMWRREDVAAYFFRLILEWARLQSLDRDAMSFVFPEDGD